MMIPEAQTPPCSPPPRPETDYKAMYLKLTERFEKTIDMMYCEIKEKDKLLHNCYVEIDELKTEKYDYFKRIEDLSDELEESKSECKNLINNINDLEQTIEQQELSIKIYKDNDGEGLSEFCEKVNEDLEKLQNKYNQLEEENENNLELVIQSSHALKDLFVECVRLSNDENCLLEGGEIVLDNIWNDCDYSGLIVDLINELNEDDWNEDDGTVQFDINIKRQLGYNVVRIKLVMNDSDDE